MTFTRREFIAAGVVTGAAAGISGLTPGRAAQPSGRLVTVRDWLKADRAARTRGIELCLQRIRELEPTIHAWVDVQPPRPGTDGSLADIPFGAKDIIETLGMATEYGSPLYKGRRGSTDAAIIRDLRGRGAVLIGKTVTTAFAYRTPGPTRNPRNLGYTPGGSSSGSAAAIAADMVPFTIGEQTRGSMIRPASFCGVTGFKPTYDLLSMDGVLIVARSLDTLGLFTHTPEDMLALWTAMGHDAGRDESLAFGYQEPVVGCEPAMVAAFRESVGKLRQADLALTPIDIADTLRTLDEANNVLQSYEGAQRHQARLKEFGDRLDPALAALIRDGLKIPAARYDEAKRYIAASRVRMANIFKATPVILTPAAIGPAPLGLSTTGDPRMNAPWTALGTPAISVPMPVGAGLPLGLQLTADLGRDAQLLRAAVRAAAALRPAS